MLPVVVVVVVVVLFCRPWQPHKTRDMTIKHAAEIFRGDIFTMFSNELIDSAWKLQKGPLYDEFPGWGVGSELA
jgi:hypothetical protein